MISSIGRTKTPTTRRDIQPGDILDGERIAAVEHKQVDVAGDLVSVTRLKFKGERCWGEWLFSSWSVSVHR